jgi:hypothetical protein
MVNVCRFPLLSEKTFCYGDRCTCNNRLPHLLFTDRHPSDGTVRYSSLDPEYLSQLDDVVLMHTAAQYYSALGQMETGGESGTGARAQIRVYLGAVMLELERRGLDAGGWHIEADSPAKP